MGLLVRREPGIHPSPRPFPSNQEKRTVMKRALVYLSLFAVISILSPVAAQQANLANSTMTWNGQNGPPWPITGVALGGGSQVTVQISSGTTTSAPFVLATAASLAPFGLPVLGGSSLLDLDLATTLIIWDPTIFPQFNTGMTGTYSLTATLPQLPAGITVPYQAAVYDPSSPTNVRLTAATEIVTTAGNVTINHTLGGDNYVTVNLSTSGISLVSYGTTYNQFYVGANGLIGYQPLSTDFTSSPGEFTSQVPRVALLWCDLEPPQGGTVVTTIDMSSQIVPVVRTDYTNIQSFGTGQPAHTMAWEHWAAPVDFVFIHQSVLQQASNFTMMVGITKGSAGTSGNQVDLTNIQNGGGMLFGPGVPIFEWFGYAGQTYYSGPTNTFDLFGRTFQFIPVSGGYQML